MLTTPINSNPWLLEQSQLFPYCQFKDAKLWRCPADRSVSVHGGATYPRVRTLAVNSWLVQSPGYRVFKKMSDLTVPGPSMTWVLMDEREDSIDDGYFAVNMAGWSD